MIYILNLELLSVLLRYVIKSNAMKQIFLSIFLLLPCLVDAQPYLIKQLGMKEGLSNNYVVSIAQDKKGHLWFATEEGLNKFDGYRFTPYYKSECNDTPNITGNELNCLLDDPDPKAPILYIGTQRAGLNAYNYDKGTFTIYRHDEKNPESIITDDITKVIPASDGNLWICTYWEGIDYLNKQTGKFTHYNTQNVQGLPSNHIWDMVDGGNGKIYIGHVQHGFSILSVQERTAKNFMHDPHNPQSLPGNEVTCVYKDHNGNIWIGTDKGLALFNPENESFVSFNEPAGQLSHRIYDICQPDDNKLWIAMEFGGIALLDLSQHMFQTTANYQFTFIREGDDEYGLSNASIRCLFQDSFKNIWAGSWGGGINFIKREPSLFKSYKYSPSLAIDNSLTGKIVSSLCIDQDNRLWIGTDGSGINVFEKGKRTDVYNSHNSHLNSNTVQTSLCDSKGQLWFGLFYGGIVRFDQKNHTFQQVYLSGHKDRQNIDVRALNEDNEGRIWIATSEGIYCIDRDTRNVLSHHDKENNLARCILKDAHQRIWVGFYGSGLGMYDSQMNDLKLFNVKSNFPSNTINALYEDSHKRLWVGTGEGLVCFPSLLDTTYIVYQRENGLNNTHIQAIGEDKQGNIWVSTNKGISCLLHDSIFYNYNRYDNLPIGNFSRNCMAITREGHFYVGSIDGVSYFHPETVLQKRQAPPALITSLEITNPLNTTKQQFTVIPDPDNKIDLTYMQNSFIIRFNIQNYALTDQVEYAYMLKGLENSWYILHDPHNVTFRNLPPGKYEFQIKTRIHNQEWSEAITSLNIHIAPPLWQTLWAKAFYLVTFIGIAYTLFNAYKKRLDAETLYKLEKQNLQHEQELNNERLRFYTNITHELRTPLTLILGPLEDMQKNNSLSAKDAQKLSVIHQSAIRLLNLINQILEFRKTETQNRKLCVCRGNIAALVHETGLKYRELNQKPDVEIKLDIEEENITMYFDKEMIQSILDNLISNAIKYTEKGNITIGIRLAERTGICYTELWVSDTGYGIHPDALPHIFERYYQEGGKHQASGTGIGLALVKNLVKLHEGEISVESKLNQGSTFRISLLTDNFYPNALHTDIQQNDAEKTTEQEPEPNADERPILLVVEDNQDIRDYIAESFSEHFDVRTAANGKEGRDIALKIIPDIIVSDIMMPVMDGNEMCRALKSDVRTSHIPIILLTAKDSLHDKEEGYAVGADSYLTKPFSASLLHSRIENLIQNRRILSEHFRSKSGEAPSKSAAVMESLNKLDNEFIHKINELIEARLSSDKIDVGYLSDKMCMSSSTLYRKMKALTGMSANEYVRKMKMKYAEQFLLEGKYTISEIAAKVGINNLFYFRQCFKEEYGVIPSEYLKQLREKAGGEPS